ncbi:MULTISPECIES: hypothetical protein [Sphingobacterium]|uniref:hypothetical protein n=1 Tax=Sphingobacterium TaxID=28453 RepID=UPI00257D3071|nr:MULTISPECIES: hypothetical protein [Sphingobacterium]
MAYKLEKITDESIISHFARKFSELRIKKGTANTYYALDSPYYLEGENYFAVCKKTTTNYVTDVYKYDDVVEEAKKYVSKNITTQTGRIIEGFLMNDINYKVEFSAVPEGDITIVTLTPIEPSK